MAKAESTEYPAEAETLLAKAQELMSRHAFDDAMLRSARSATPEPERQGGGSVSLVLVDRSQAVNRAYAARFPHVRPVRTQASSKAGLQSGRAAADRAPLGQRPIGGDRQGLQAG